MYTPLRYPGGKRRLAPYIANLIAAQDRPATTYAEPFAGGAGAALKLLVDERVDRICINDLHTGIASFWKSVFGQTDRFSSAIESCVVTVDEWHRQRAIYLDPQDHDEFTVGFATFFLNRTNRSGILNARPIGGLNQNGNWKIDARFNKPELAGRVRFLGGYRHRVTVTQMDARAFLESLEPESDSTFVYVDPPYVVQGDDLYLDRLTLDDHQELADQLKASTLTWFMTYDANDVIANDLYEGVRCATFNISHTAQHQHIGSEYALFSEDMVVPGLDILPNDLSRWVTV
ncbi:DNA adenine methylase [Rarobacter faecitabidus]|uniref:site-specific DNA-methyltransferase (adenine-specific) n=2 Tax=Rarobacter faecitabidus TaxID=13243 RepID=A0A542ZDZ6_RARFA|nr:DNA adenine methylase [Rarobacter faecitabidus]